jgi:uracil-DNA glycosylase
MAFAAHVAPLNRLVDRIRRDSPSPDVPYFDPADGGMNAQCLFVLEAPGPNAVKSGFISRDNPDETAKNFLLLNEEAALPRELTAIWNIVPWYIGSNGKIRPANRSDISLGLEYLKEVCRLLAGLRAIVLVGQKAQRVTRVLAAAFPNVTIHQTAHPSPLYVNNKPGNRALLLDAFRAVRESLVEVPSTDV